MCCKEIHKHFCQDYKKVSRKKIFPHTEMTGKLRNIYKKSCQLSIAMTDFNTIFSGNNVIISRKQTKFAKIIEKAF